MRECVVCDNVLCSSHSAAESKDLPQPAPRSSDGGLGRPLVSDDRSVELERHLVIEQRKRQELEETVSLLLHQQHNAPPSPSTVRNIVSIFTTFHACIMSFYSATYSSVCLNAMHVLALSVRLTTIFPGEPGLAGFIGAKDGELVEL